MDHKIRNKTLRKPSSKKPTVGTIFSIDEPTKDEKPISHSSEETKSIDSAFISLLSTESISALKRPWLRLERGARIKKFRSFANDYITDENKKLSDSEKESLIKFLIASNDNKQLNSKQIVLYDMDEGKITDIKGLKMIRNEEKGVVFKIEGSRATKRSKPSESKIEHE
jgi:hypothetical protein